LLVRLLLWGRLVFSNFLCFFVFFQNVWSQISIIFARCAGHGLVH
jgi:hypothetical protein